MEVVWSVLPYAFALSTLIWVTLIVGSRILLSIRSISKTDVLVYTAVFAITTLFHVYAYFNDSIVAITLSKQLYNLLCVIIFIAYLHIYQHHPIKPVIITCFITQIFRNIPERIIFSWDAQAYAFRENSYVYLFSIAGTILFALLLITLLRFLISLIYAKYALPERTWNRMVILTVVLYCATQIIDVIYVFQGHTHSSGIDLYAIIFTFILEIIIASIVIIICYFSFRMHYKVIIRDERLKELNYYITEVESQHMNIRKLRHDIKNIILSLDTYIEEQDFVGLCDYYRTKIQPFSSSIFKNDLILDQLQNITIPEIKGVLATKLITAYSNSQIQISFEARDQITEISIDLLDYIRMIGIMLDNAIQELEEMGEGDLWVAIYNNDGTIVLVVENTCREDTPPVQDLIKMGFTTKKTGQGIGIPTLMELQGKYKNVGFEITIKDCRFTQILSVQSTMNLYSGK